MPLTDLIRNLNDVNARPAHWAQGISQFVSTNGRVYVRYAHLLLETALQPIVETATGKVHGHAASLLAYHFSTSLPAPAEGVFMLPGDNEEFVYLDRLVRTLHTLNYLTQPNQGNLLLRVHPLHIASVPTDHGLAFEGILRSCGLLPKQITLELEIDEVDDGDHLKLAVDNYRSRGFGIAVKTYGRTQLNVGLISKLRPDFVKLDPLMLSSARPLQRLTDQVHQVEARVLIEGNDAFGLRSGAAKLGIDLLQLHGPARCDLRASRAIQAWSSAASASRTLSLRS